MRDHSSDNPRCHSLSPGGQKIAIATPIVIKIKKTEKHSPSRGEIKKGNSLEGSIELPEYHREKKGR